MDSKSNNENRDAAHSSKPPKLKERPLLKAKVNLGIGLGLGGLAGILAGSPELFHLLEEKTPESITPPTDNFIEQSSVKLDIFDEIIRQNHIVDSKEYHDILQDTQTNATSVAGSTQISIVNDTKDTDTENANHKLEQLYVHDIEPVNYNPLNPVNVENDAQIDALHNAIDIEPAMPIEPVMPIAHNNLLAHDNAQAAVLQINPIQELLPNEFLPARLSFNAINDDHALDTTPIDIKPSPLDAILGPDLHLPYHESNTSNTIFPSNSDSVTDLKSSLFDKFLGPDPHLSYNDSNTSSTVIPHDPGSPLIKPSLFDTALQVDHNAFDKNSTSSVGIEKDPTPSVTEFDDWVGVLPTDYPSSPVSLPVNDWLMVSSTGSQSSPAFEVINMAPPELPPLDMGAYMGGSGSSIPVNDHDYYTG